MCLDRRPVVSAPSIAELSLSSVEFTTFNSLDPSRVAESKPLLALDKAMALVMVFLNDFPIVNSARHIVSIANKRSQVCNQNVADLLPVERQTAS